MKRTIVAILAIAPVLLHAQVKSPAQPSSTPVLQSSIIQPAALAAVKSIDNATATVPPVRVSTGVIAPKLIHSVDVNSALIRITKTPGRDNTVVVDMTVDETGKPANLKLIQSADQVTNQAVLAAASQYRYQPATLDGAPVPISLTLKYTIQ
jgi:TonB family protein